MKPMLLFTLAMPIWAGWTIGGTPGTFNSSSTVTDVPVSLSVTAGHGIFVYVTTPSGVTLSMADNAAGGTNTYTAGPTYTSNRPTLVSSWTAVAKATEALTITMHSTTAQLGMTIVAFEAWPSSGVFPNTVNVSGSSSGTASVTLTVTGNDVLLIGVGDASGTVSAGTGFTQITFAQSAQMRTHVEYKTGNTSGSNVVTYTVGTPRGLLGIAYTAPLASASIKHRVTQ